METTVEITALAHGGDGIGRVEGQVYFVPGGLPGDVLRVKPTRQTKNAAWAEIVAVETASTDRRTIGDHEEQPSVAATWYHFAYPAQQEWKVRMLKDALQRIGGLECAVDWIDDPALRTGYRTRAEFHGDGVHLGFFAPNSHQIVDTPSCPLLHPKLNVALKTLHRMDIKGSITVTVNPEGEEVLVWSKFTKRKLKAWFPLSNTPRDETAPSRFLFDGVPIVNGGFSQASLLLNRHLQREVHAMVRNAVSVLDLYCGNGNLSVTLPESVAVTGIDHNKAAVKAAWSMKRGDYITGDEKRMIKAIESGDFDTVVVDPPRSGAKSIMPALAKSHARAIVCVSCDPPTFARDLKTLKECGWQVESAKAIDLFPYTPHVECVARLVRA
ncbi:MAG: class I SAM-dependent RNA methyltransferase [Candidatus Hydrogenedentes bacterium]|nr:class I SAM-dependent RNA methyltransferase [Candidatus Hydrogenedentota bacterium]